MLTHRLILLLTLLSFLHAKPLDRTRRSLDLMTWQTAHVLYQQLYTNDEKTNNLRRQIRSEYRPVEGPMNIEQLPAMLAARSVKRYPYSRQNDPAVIG